MIEPNILAFQNADLLQAIETPPEGGWTKGALAAHFDRDHSNLNKTLKVLAGEGMVVAGELALTEAGKAQLAAFQRAKAGVVPVEATGRVLARHLQRNPLNRPIDRAHVHDLAETAEDIGDFLVPILVSPPDANGVRTIWAGEHRWEAVKYLTNLDRCPEILRTEGLLFTEREATPGEAAVIALIENSTSLRLPPWQDALQLRKAADDLNLNASELARRIGRTREGTRGGLRDVQVKLKVAREAKPHDIAAYEADPKAPGAWERLRDSVTERPPEPVLTKAQRLALAELFACADRVVGAEVRVLPSAHTAEGARLAQYGLAILIRDDKGDRAKVTQAGADYLVAEKLDNRRQLLGYTYAALKLPDAWNGGGLRTEWLNLPNDAPAAPAPDPEIKALQGIVPVSAGAYADDGIQDVEIFAAPNDKPGPNGRPVVSIKIGHIEGQGWIAATQGSFPNGGWASPFSDCPANSARHASRDEALSAAIDRVRQGLNKHHVGQMLAAQVERWLMSIEGVASPPASPAEDDPLVVNGVRYPNLTRANEARRLAAGGGPVNSGRGAAKLTPSLKSMLQNMEGKTDPPEGIDDIDAEEARAAAALAMLTAERERQVRREGWSAEHDDEENNFGELADAAAAYAVAANSAHDAAQFWPGSWDPKTFKPTGTVRDLVKAGALILAEIERRLRAGETA